MLSFFKAQLDKLSVGGKLLILSLFFGISFCGVVTYTVVTLQQQKADSSVINIAGRQRMLTQKFTKELFDELNTQQNNSGPSLTEKTKILFEVSLKALQQGGITYSDLGMKNEVPIPGTESPEIAQQLNTVATAWNELQLATQKLRASSPSSAEYFSLLNQVRKANINTLKNMHKTVGMLTTKSENNVAKMMTMESLILLTILAIGSFFAFFVTQRITHPLKNIVTAIQQIKSGDLNIDPQLLENSSIDETAMVAREFKEMLTVLNNLQDEINALNRAIKNGELSKRSHNARFEGSWGNMLMGINSIVDGFVGPFEKTTHYIDRISHGDIPQAITEEYQGDFNQVKVSLNRCIESIQGVICESDQLISAAREGDLNQRGDHAKFSGSWAKLVEGLNGLFDTVVGPIKNNIEIMESLADGDLTKIMNGNYKGEFASLQSCVNGTINKLHAIVTEISEASSSVQSGANEIADGVTDLSQRTEEQASSLEETASSMEEMASSIRESSKNSVHANQLAISARDIAEKGGLVVNNAVQAMDEINGASKKIADIISVIDEIAFQTNLLALNAAVEAARAGEQGRGFAVVASEVRNLAGRSADAAKEIKILIEDSVSKAKDGSKHVNNSGETLKEIIESVAEMVTKMGDITRAANEQVSGIDQVNTAVGQMDQMTQQNAALVEQASAASEAMAEQAIQMNQLLSYFSVGGQASAQQFSTSSPSKQITVPTSSNSIPASSAINNTDDAWEEF